ncbi:imidazole glycerol phosphate synthase subunit HisH [Gilvibacter sediminis]|uniref:imidazole glycerol phosphate synthase subunit HisH n=1 Tax=Gilvibacter sediminis TaxID=379071 RepID=UPI002350B83D|nr:imidazole glycerol phosphate synthase subunit HisH [Gilvibacter sediminis]MDC7997896.1 imidazole glycerol phosphate synthase subunit HisH [Gilvibacter sediminis]
MIAIVKYNAGNIRSVENALKRIGADCVISDDPEVLSKADKLILPGVGEASSAMAYLRDRGLDQVIKKRTKPTLGICLGLQLFCARSEEGNTECLGIFPEAVKRFPPEEKVPHMGWNELTELKSPLFKGVQANSDVYFVHSFYAEKGPDTIAACDYILPFSAALSKGNFYATQFHPEKSADVGEQILANFLKLPSE